MISLIGSAQNADRDLKTAAITVWTGTPSASLNLWCIGLVKLGDGTKNLDGTGGSFSLYITVGGQTAQPSPQIVSCSTAVRTAFWTTPFPVPANDAVVIQVKSPNAADTDVDTTVYLYDISTTDAIALSGDSTAADNCELMFDGTGYAGGTAKLGVDVVAISADTTAADNCELMFDGTGYAGGTAKLGVDAVAISGDATAADNLESFTDGTGYVGGTAKLTVDAVKWNGTAVATPATAGYPAVTIKSGTGTGEVSLSSGVAQADVAKWNATAVATPATAGYPAVTIKSGTGTGEVSLTSGVAQADVAKWKGTTAATVDTAGYPVVTVKDGTGAGEINTASGKVPATIAAGDIANDAITAASIATDAIDADALASTAITEFWQGAGTRSVVITVKDTNTSGAVIDGARIEVWDSGGATTRYAVDLATNASGETDTFYLDDGTYLLKGWKPSVYTFTSASITVTSSAITFEFYGTPVSVTSPPSATTSTLYGYMVTASGDPASGVTINAEVDTLPNLTGTTLICTNLTTTDTTDTNGYFALTVIRNEPVKVTCEAAGLKETRFVATAATVDLGTLVVST